MRRNYLPPLQTVSTGAVVAIVGFFSSFPIVLQGITKMSATPDQAASALMAAALAMGGCGIFLSLWQKQPVSVAWSTPGVALLAVSDPLASGFAGAVGAFVFAGVLTAISGLWKPLARWAAAIPIPLAHAMLSGVLLSICIQPVQAMAEIPIQASPIILTWFVVGRIKRVFAVPAAVLVAVGVIFVTNGMTIPTPETVFTPFAVTTPIFTLSALLSIGVPLYIVTMATQNIPGIAILKSFGYEPQPGKLLTSVGAASVLSAPLGSAATCLAAITAAMCSGEDSHPDHAKRYWSAVMAGVFYCVFGLFAGTITMIAGLAHPLVLGTLAGVALVGVFTGSAKAAYEDEQYREAAALTFVITASGVTIFGLGAAVWGLIVGGLVQFVSHKLK